MIRPELERCAIAEADRERVAHEVLTTYRRPDGEEIMYHATARRISREIKRWGYFTRLTYPPGWTVAQILEWHENAEHVLRLHRAGAL